MLHLSYCVNVPCDFVCVYAYDLFVCGMGYRCECFLSICLKFMHPAAVYDFLSYALWFFSLVVLHSEINEIDHLVCYRDDISLAQLSRSCKKPMLNKTKTKTKKLFLYSLAVCHTTGMDLHLMYCLGQPQIPCDGTSYSKGYLLEQWATRNYIYGQDQP